MTSAAITFGPVAVPVGQKNWCWALVAAKVVQHYRGGASGGAAIHACEIATRVLQAPGCCATPKAFDVPRDLSVALGAFGHAAPARAGLPDARELAKELVRARPVAIGVVWDDPAAVAGHFVLVTQVDDFTEMVAVWDPEDGKIHTAPLRDHILSYRDRGRWQLAYYTRP